MDTKPGGKFPLYILLAGRGDTPLHYITTSEPILNGMWAENVGDGILFGITAKTSSAGTDSWNANQECCWPPADGAGPDDEGYIDAQITNLLNAGYPVDPKRIYIIGHSAGSAMAYRYACDHSNRIAAIFQMSTFAIRTDVDTACTGGAFSSAHFHGTADTVLFDNTTNATLAPNTVEYVSADVDRLIPTRTSTTTQESTRAGCTGSYSLTASGWLDFDSSVSGSETDLYSWSGCPTWRDVQVWKGNGSAHVPAITAAGRDAILNWFATHPQP